ncbi:hypothetical protein HPB49_007898 [Dermacentor silvarum]|uniref:Uncharacterized protein n=1 Tax=Dermacentor silvarum TaxID=543639 RepID=A0ACB8DNB9_DERSI|nr:hypothetical protein HPB49_007898 [Dermacentor silvarum]
MGTKGSLGHILRRLLTSPRAATRRPMVTSSSRLRYDCNQYPCPITYVLRGFEGSCLDMRRISFVQPLPTTRVCTICWVLPAMIMPLHCGHAVCFVCSDVCLKDGVPFGDPGLEVVTSLKGIYSSLVFCVNAVFGCRSKFELGHLKVHCLHECGFNPTTCHRCGRDDIPACMIEQYFLLWKGGSPVHRADEEERNGCYSYKLFPRHSTPL